MCKALGVFLLLVGAALCVPLKDELMLVQGGDTAVVESTVREARQAPDHIKELLKPGVKNAFIRTYGDKEGSKGDIHGYSKKLQDRGNEGYNHFDSFHKKDADKYGYEVHSEFGKSDKANVDTADENGKYSDDDKNDGEESRTLYRVTGESKGDKKNKNFLDDFDFVYFGDGGGASKYIGGGDEQETEGGTSQSYETNESYASGGSGSYDSGDKNAEGSDGKSQSLKAEDDDGESKTYFVEEEEEEEDDY